MARALKPGAPLVFTYHHNNIKAYLPVAMAILDSGLTCSAVLPCPGEMGASIHISGTGSSVIDTVFVCRLTGSVQRRTVVNTAEEIAGLIRRDVELIRAGKVKPARSDIRCIAFGHLVRLAIWHLRKGWDITLSTSDKMIKVEGAIEKLGGWPGVEKHLSDDLSKIPCCQMPLAREEQVNYGVNEDEISF